MHERTSPPKVVRHRSRGERIDIGRVSIEDVDDMVMTQSTKWGGGVVDGTARAGIDLFWGVAMGPDSLSGTSVDEIQNLMVNESKTLFPPPDKHDFDVDADTRMSVLLSTGSRDKEPSVESRQKNLPWAEYSDGDESLGQRSPSPILSFDLTTESTGALNPDSIQKLASILKSSKSRKILRNLQGSQAQLMIDYLYMVLQHPPSTIPWLQKHALIALYKLSNSLLHLA
ncbi:hypothetical protein AN958_11907 [Leucoagaricus sp. SymC.cos]|nr:hypothetical protein AN958_11907 [Leucoagaricus sp. SymC.cos]